MRIAIADADDESILVAAHIEDQAFAHLIRVYSQNAKSSSDDLSR
jgi:hypothetical protein